MRPRLSKFAPNLDGFDPFADRALIRRAISAFFIEATMYSATLKTTLRFYSKNREKLVVDFTNFYRSFEALVDATTPYIRKHREKYEEICEALETARLEDAGTLLKLFREYSKILTANGIIELGKEGMPVDREMMEV